jgi:L-fuconolactonase
MKIDSHQHFWKYEAQIDSWITDEMTVIQRNFLPSDLKVFLDKFGFDGCVVVQSRQNDEHNYFLLGLAEQNHFIKGVVGWIDLQSPRLEEQLTIYSQSKKLKGFRHVLQSEPPGFMTQPSFIAGVATLAKYGFAYDLLITSSQLSEALSFVSQIPETKIIIDHIAKPAIHKQELQEWRNNMLEISKHPNTYCKVSGMVTESHWHRWKKNDFYPYLDAVSEFFGASRMLYGSDWPVCLLAASYEDQLNIVEDYFSGFSQHERDQIFGLTAIATYGLNH